MVGSNILYIDMLSNTEHAETTFKARRDDFTTQNFSLSIKETGERLVQ